MEKRGRKSAAARAVAPILIETRRPPPPAELGEGEATTWRDVTGTMPAGWFCRAQYPLLIAYCRHVSRADAMARQIAAFQPEWLKGEGGLQRLDKLMAMAERETRAIMTCARAMRLTQQAQIQPRGAGRAVANSPIGPRPWEPDD